MSNIKLDIEGINSCVSSYKTKSDNLGTLISEMDSLLQTLGGYFEGETQKAFETRYHAEFKPNLQKAQQMVQDIAQALNKAKDAMVNTDNVTAGMWK